MFQDVISKLYKQFVRLAFNITIITLIIGLFVGIFRTISELGLTITEATVRLGFKELVINVLSLIIVLELIRAFIEFFEHEGVKMSTFGIHRLGWLMVSKRFPWNAKYETVHRWSASFIVI